MTRTRRFLLLILAAFLIYAVIQYPQDSADKVRWIWDWLLGALQAIGEFFGSVISGS